MQGVNYSLIIYISPNDVSNIIDSKLLLDNKELIDYYNQTFNKEINLEINNSIINLYDYIDCNNAPFISKCHLKNINNKLVLDKIKNYLI